MSIQNKSNNIELTTFLSQPAETAQPDVLKWLGKHVESLSPDDVPLLERLREEKFQNASTAQQKELNYYIKRLQSTGEEGAESSLHYPYWIHKLIKKAAIERDFPKKAISLASLIQATEDQQLKEELVAFLIKTDIDEIKHDFKFLNEPLKTLLVKRYIACNTGIAKIAKAVPFLEIEEESTRLELADLCVEDEKGAAAFVKNMRWFKISDETKRIALLKRALSFEKAAKEFISLLHALPDYCGISDPSVQLELVEQCAKWKSSAILIPQKFSALNISGAQHEATRIRFAFLCSKTKKGACAVVGNLENFAISNQWVKQKIAFLCCRHGGSKAVARYFDKFEFSDPTVRMRWAMRLSKDPECLDVIPYVINSFFTFSQCKNEQYKQERYEIAKRCAQNKEGVSSLIPLIQHFYFSNEETYSILKLCVKNADLFYLPIKLTESQRSELCGLNAYFNLRAPIFATYSLDIYDTGILKELTDFPKQWSGTFPVLFKMQQKKWKQPRAKKILQAFIQSHFSDPFSAHLNAMLEEIDQFSTNNSLKDNARTRQQLLHWFSGTLFILFAEELSKEETQWIVDQRLLYTLKELRNPKEHLPLACLMIRAVKDKQLRKKLALYQAQLPSSQEKKSHSQVMELIALDVYFNQRMTNISHHLLTPQMASELADFPNNWSGAFPLLIEMPQKQWDQTQAKTILQTFIHSHFSDPFSSTLSAMLEEIDRFSTNKSLEDDEHTRQQLLHWFSGTLFILFAEELSEEEAKWLVDQKLLPSLKGFRNPTLRLLLTHSVIRGVKQSPWREGFADYETRLKPSERKDKNPYLEKYLYNRLFRVLLVSLKNSGIDEGILESFTNRIDQAYCKSKQGKREHFFWETKRFGTLIQILHSLAESDLNPEEKGQILQKLEKISTDNTDLMKNLYSLLTIMNFEELECAIQNPSVSFQELAELLFKEKVPIGQVDHFPEKYLNTFGSSREPRALPIYAATLSTLSDPDAMLCIGDYATAVLNGTFAEERSSDKRSPTLAKIGSLFPEVKDKWLHNYLKFKLSDLVQTQTTIKGPFSFHDFFKTQIIQFHHLDAKIL